MQSQLFKNWLKSQKKSQIYNCFSYVLVSITLIIIFIFFIDIITICDSILLNCICETRIFRLLFLSINLFLFLIFFFFNGSPNSRWPNCSRYIIRSSDYYFFWNNSCKIRSAKSKQMKKMIFTANTFLRNPIQRVIVVMFFRIHINRGSGENQAHILYTLNSCLFRWI